jgi:hypothetical protein
MPVQLAGRAQELRNQRRWPDNIAKPFKKIADQMHLSGLVLLLRLRNHSLVGFTWLEA